MAVESLKSDLLNISRDRKILQERAINGNGSMSINSDNYDPMFDITELFNDPTALSEIDSLMNYSNLYQLQLEKEIREQRAVYKEILLKSRDSGDLESVEKQVVELVESFEGLKGLVGSTGHTINAMTENIKLLDYSKKNLTFTMTTLKRLQMLVTAYDRLEKQLEKEKQVKNYSEIRQLLSAVMELNAYFQDFQSIDEINKLNKMINTLRNHLIQDIFKDFELEIEDVLDNPQLDEACHILELLGEAYKQQLQNWYLDTTLKGITEIFKSTEEAGSLDNLHRRFIYFQNILGNFESKHLPIFPKSWEMSVKLSVKFCSYTRDDLKDVLGKDTGLKSSSYVNVLLNSLSQTLDFEQFLNKKYKYHKDFDDELTRPNELDFTRSISDVFEPFLSYWVDSQVTVIQKKIQEFMNPAVMFNKIGQEENKEGEDGEQINILESSAELFRIFRQMLSQLSKLTTGTTLVKLSNVFEKCLIDYQNRVLDSILPDSKSFVSVDMEAQKEGIDVICLVLNTASYCSTTITQLEEKFKSLIENEALSDKVKFDKSNDGFMQLVSYCINLLFYKIENDIQLSWKELANFNWKVLSEVVGESRYITSLKTSIRGNCDYIFQRVSKPVYVKNLIDKVVDMLLKNTLANMIKLEPISVVMAEQFKLDIQELKTFVNVLAGSEKRSVGLSFKSSVDARFKNMDNLMKILMISGKPMDFFINSYFMIIGDYSFSNFIKILRLKGIIKDEVSEKDKFKYMDLFKLQIRVFEEAAGEDEVLSESNAFIESIKLPNGRNVGHGRSNSRSIYLPSTVSSSLNNVLTPPEPPMHANGGNNSGNTGVSPETSPKPNFGFFNTSKTFAEKGNFNENFKKFFKRGE